MKKPPLIRKWYSCPYCKKRLLIYDNTAKSKGIYIKCKNCGKEVEIKVQ